MLIDIILIAIGLIWVIVACISDLRTQEVPDWISFSLVALALGIRLMYALIYSDWPFFLYGLAGLAVAFIVGAGFYYAHIWGGGDAKLLAGLGALFATAPFNVSQGMPFLAVLVTNILIFGALWSMLWAVFLLVNNFRKVVRKSWGFVVATKKIIYLLVLSAVSFLVLAWFAQDGFVRIMLIALAVLLVVYYLFYVMIKAIESVAMFKRLSISSLRVGDWVGRPVIVKRRVICSPSDYGLTQGQIDLLKKSKVKSIVIKQGIEFVP